MLKVKDIDDATAAFSAYVIREKLIPPLSAIPKEFKSGNDKWSILFCEIFYSGGQAGKDLYLRPKKDVDAKKAFRQIREVMGSFEPRHEHKVAGVAFMFSEWFESYEWRDGEEGQKGSKFFFEYPDEEV